MVVEGEDGGVGGSGVGGGGRGEDGGGGGGGEAKMVVVVVVVVVVLVVVYCGGGGLVGVGVVGVSGGSVGVVCVGGGSGGRHLFITLYLEFGTQTGYKGINKRYNTSTLELSLYLASVLLAELTKQL